MSFLKLVNEQKLHKLKVERSLDKIFAKFEGVSFCLHDWSDISISIWETDDDTEHSAKIILFDKDSYNFKMNKGCKITPETIEKIIQALVKQ